ncbi:MAG: hypothetical protein JSV21_09715 [Nitrospirota bacterium]|nr:MAG: hypothetical protein JSV21_09715 [Nitrospirota bacterium]
MIICLAVVLIAFPLVALAGESDVLKVDISRMGGNEYSFEVTVQHEDEGWKHYADRWEVLGPDGKVIATRTLLHPHVDEQPFTRGLSGVYIPVGIDIVTIRAHDKVHGFGGKAVNIKVPR